MLEQPERIAVAVRQVAQLRFLQRGGQGDLQPERGHAHGLADGDDDPGVAGLLGVQIGDLWLLARSALSGVDGRRSDRDQPGQQ